ncbi:MAG: holo-ACP synthase [Litorilinea sp.]
MLRTGVDMIEICRLQEAVDRHGARFLERVYTPGELGACRGRLESLAARFAAKEAAAKALGTGIGRTGIRWTDIEVCTDAASGAPELLLHGPAAQQAAALGMAEWSVSLSHDRERAIAFVVMLGTHSP